jgi:membrane protease YdiL (CAAX protease family)
VIIITTIIVFVFWTAYRLFVPTNTFVDEIIAKPIIWLTPILLVTRFASLGFSRKEIVKNIFIGLTCGFVFSLERIFASRGLTYSFSWLFILSSFSTALVEEIFFRGFVLSRWLKKYQKPWLILILNGLLFTTFHIPYAIFQLHYSGYNLFTYLFSNFIFGLIDVVLFFTTKSIYAPIGNHFIWNVFSSLFR